MNAAFVHRWNDTLGCSTYKIGFRAGFLRPNVGGDAQGISLQIQSGVSFLKELFVSRAPWRIFLRALHGKAVLGFVAVRLGFQFGNMVVTVLFSEVVCAVLFIAAAPLSIPS